MIPVLLDIAMVHVAPSVVMKITEKSFMPNQMMANGSQAILGTVCKATTRKPSVSSRKRYLANRKPSVVPIRIERMKAVRSLRILSSVAPSSCPWTNPS